MKAYIENLYQELREDLAIYGDLGAPAVRRLSGKLTAINEALEKLKIYIIENPFGDNQQEVEFFKEAKPLFVSEQLMSQEMYNIETQRPLTDEADIRAFYTKELNFIEHYLDKQQFLYQYYLLEGIELDNLLFVRGAETSTVLLPETPDLDPVFSTKGSYLFAKFIAYERLREFLLRELYPNSEREKLKRVLNWTGDKMNLIEIAYGIYDTAQINKGDVDIKDIISWLEDSLNISLQRHYRLFSEMKNRKSVSPTRYLDHMGDMVKQHLTEGEAFRPQVPKPVSGSKSGTSK